VYIGACASCHGIDGAGVSGENPSLQKTNWVLGAEPALIRIVLAGMSGTTVVDEETFTSAMPAEAGLTNRQVADVLTFVRQDFGNRASAVSPKLVARVRARL
jgi:mono/diheme cytochrome c family protein